jgi:type VI secretion system protein VasG
VYATLAFADDRIRGAYLLTAMLKTPELRRTLLAISNHFGKIDTEQIVANVPAWVAQSPERHEAAFDGSGLAASIPERQVRRYRPGPRARARSASTAGI